MNKLAISASTLLLSLFALTATSCGGSTSSDPAAGAPAQAATADGATSSVLNIRYIDSDSLMTHYNLAKDFQEASMRAVSKIESARQAKAGEIQKFAAAIEQKARSNGYLSEASYNADMQKLQKMQQDAENYLANLSRNTENELGQQQLQLNDSIENYVKLYNASKGYDAILFKAAGIYFNPKLDITRDIIDGLNARYNKVESAK
ncbi:OmpH family outer membrane protein [uncultured Duncaniella sp.]|uniref:OmpH family outer membrane protein n=1 Tax=uncultured Duncaniella sp. TaxID=2768039 RepID=UPI0023C117DF|nr:OmpH family outer membrane protein [uncultured Duncaniella sp.]MDE5664397.1 OmpH family outer membrane protein [Duncaniella sp.]MDE5960317.1 OmpH family outer membrane protein [Duncaniella sp.]MDE6186988.1 OmpH family outer membrane protein [Duncaniella sp.]